MNHLINMLGQSASFMEKIFDPIMKSHQTQKINSKCLKESNAWEKTF